EHLRILSLNDINTELDEKEIDSWIRLTRVLTHEIMNAITPITSLSDTLLSLATPGNEEIRNGLQTISTTGKGLLAFVESYRRFTRIPSPEPSLFYLKPFLDRMIELARHQNNCSHITFRVEIEPADLILYADENLITQVSVNLLKNAIQAIGTQPDGVITLRAYGNAAEEVLIEFRNNGKPIPPDVAPHIFIPFFTTKEGGSGIGLSISRQIMRLSGGSIVLLPDKETRFVLTFN
ncbi:MAG: HAMP domain-containing sensor histidine kinase, partial [Bacteroides sp.]